jgi:hypothetical protein
MLTRVKQQRKLHPEMDMSKMLGSCRDLVILYQTQPKQKAAVGLAHSFSSHFLKLHLRTKYVSYVGGLPPPLALSEI